MQLTAMTKGAGSLQIREKLLKYSQMAELKGAWEGRIPPYVPPKRAPEVIDIIHALMPPGRVAEVKPITDRKIPEPYRPESVLVMRALSGRIQPNE